MKLKEYKENIVSGYENRKEGLLMYKHQKLFDISNFIKQVVDIGIEGKLTTDEYMKEVEKLFQKMPEEFKEQYKDKYDEFILAHEKTKERIEYYKKTDINTTFSPDEIKLITRDAPKNLENDDINVSQYGMTTIVSLPEEYWNQKYRTIYGFSINKLGEREKNINHRKIYMSEVSKNENWKIDHEYTHVLHSIGLLKEFLDIYKVENSFSSPHSLIDTLLKDEFLALIGNDINFYIGNNSKLKKDDLIISRLVVSYLGKYIEMCKYDNNIIVDNHVGTEIDKKTGEKIYNFCVYQEEIKGEKKPLSEKTMKLFLEKANLIEYMYQTYEKIYKICVPKYYPHKDQFHYMLAFTPLSQWGDVLRTYQKIEKIEKTKSDIADTFSSEKDKSK